MISEVPEAYNHSYLSLRKLHAQEVPIHKSPVRIEDKNHNHVTFGGTPKFKDRLAVLCPTRLLMFKSE